MLSKSNSGLKSTILIFRHSLAHSRNHCRFFIKTGSVSSHFRQRVPAFVSTDPVVQQPLLSQFRIGMPMILKQRRTHFTSGGKKIQETEQENHKDHILKNGHTCTNGVADNTHHSHFPLFGHSHSHHEEHARDPEKIIEALKGTGLCCWLLLLYGSDDLS